MLGFERTYRRLRPNPYVALRREELRLHFFGSPGFHSGVNWIRIVTPPSRLQSRRHQLGQSAGERRRPGRPRGDAGQALKILEGALTRERAAAPAADLAEAEAYRNELRKRVS